MKQFAAGPLVALLTAPVEGAAGYHAAPKKKKKAGAVMGLLGGIGGGLLGVAAGNRLRRVVRSRRGRRALPVAGALIGGTVGGAAVGASLRGFSRIDRGRVEMSRRENLAKQRRQDPIGREAGIPLTGQIAHDRYVIENRRQDIAKRDSNILRAGIAGTAAGAVLGGGHLPLKARLAAGALAGAGSVIGVRAVTHKKGRDVYGARQPWAARSEAAPAVIGAGAAGYGAYRMLRKRFLKMSDARKVTELGIRQVGGVRLVRSKGLGEEARQKSARKLERIALRQPVVDGVLRAAVAISKGSDATAWKTIGQARTAMMKPRSAAPRQILGTVAKGQKGYRAYVNANDASLRGRLRNVVHHEKFHTLPVIGHSEVLAHLVGGLRHKKGKLDVAEGARMVKKAWDDRPLRVAAEVGTAAALGKAVTATIQQQRGKQKQMSDARKVTEFAERKMSAAQWKKATARLPDDPRQKTVAKWLKKQGHNSYVNWGWTDGVHKTYSKKYKTQGDRLLIHEENGKLNVRRAGDDKLVASFSAIELAEKKKRQMNPYVMAGLSGAASGAALGLLPLMRRGVSLRTAARTAAGGAAAGGAIVGGGSLLGSSILGDPDNREGAAFTKRAAAGGAIVGGTLGIAGGLAARRVPVIKQTIRGLSKEWRPAVWIRQSSPLKAAAIGGAAGGAYGLGQGADEGQQVDSIRNIRKDLKRVHGFSADNVIIKQKRDTLSKVRDAAHLAASLGVLGVAGYAGWRTHSLYKIGRRKIPQVARTIEKEAPGVARYTKATLRSIRKASSQVSQTSRDIPAKIDRIGTVIDDGMLGSGGFRAAFRKKRELSAIMFEQEKKRNLAATAVLTGAAAGGAVAGTMIGLRGGRAVVRTIRRADRDVRRQAVRVEKTIKSAARKVGGVATKAGETQKAVRESTRVYADVGRVYRQAKGGLYNLLHPVNTWRETKAAFRAGLQGKNFYPTRPRPEWALSAAGGKVCLDQFGNIVELEKPFSGYNKKRHARTGGLNDRYREQYNREHGSKLKRPVTTEPSRLKPGSKAAKRRASFCARMGGMQGPTSKDGKLTPKGAALKRWNCSAKQQLIEMNDRTYRPGSTAELRSMKQTPAVREILKKENARGAWKHRLRTLMKVLPFESRTVAHEFSVARSAVKFKRWYRGENLSGIQKTLHDSAAGMYGAQSPAAKHMRAAFQQDNRRANRLILGAGILPPVATSAVSVGATYHASRRREFAMGRDLTPEQRQVRNTLLVTGAVVVPAAAAGYMAHRSFREADRKYGEMLNRTGMRPADVYGGSRRTNRVLALPAPSATRGDVPRKIKEAYSTGTSWGVRTIDNTAKPSAKVLSRQGGGVNVLPMDYTRSRYGVRNPKVIVPPPGPRATEAMKLRADRNMARKPIGQKRDPKLKPVLERGKRLQAIGADTKNWTRGERKAAKATLAILRKRYGFASKQKVTELDIYARNKKTGRASGFWDYTRGEELVGRDKKAVDVTLPAFIGAAQREATTGWRYARRAGGLAQDVSEVASGQKTKKREWEKGWFRNAVAVGGMGAGLLAHGLIYRSGKINPRAPRWAKSYTRTVDDVGKSINRTRSSLMKQVNRSVGLSARLKRISLDYDAAMVGWDVRDPRGRSARVFAPGARPRYRRQADWHETKDGQRKVLIGAGVLGALATGAGGMLVGRRIGQVKTLVKRRGIHSGYRKEQKSKQVIIPFPSAS